MPCESGEVGHILVVDDDAMVRQTITTFLEEQNVPANSVSCRQDLNSHLEKAHPSLILLDLRLGREDGLDVLKEIRSHSNIPIIIIMTGHSREEVDRVVGLELGADDYLAKPFSLRELLARVRAVLRRHERGRATRARDPEGAGTGLTAGRLNVRRLVNPDGAPVDQKRIRLAARVSQSATTAADAGDASSSNTSPRGHFRPKHRCSSLAVATQARDRPKRAAYNRDGARRWLYLYR
jgi:DNA-binding response OmpR family regulator